MKRQKVLKILSENKKQLLDNYRIESLSVFGSVARDEARDDSDVDILVVFTESVGLFQFIALQQQLEMLLGCSVDLGTPRSLRSEFRRHVLQEAIRVA